MSLVWHNVTRYAVGRPPQERSSMHRVPAPTFADGHVAWRSDQIGLETIHEPSARPVTRTLFDGDAGRIVWECVAPAARARFDRDGVTTAGAGYVERLTMTVPPSALPMTELRWGRFVSDDAAVPVTWIDWRGARPQSWVAAKGAVHTDAVVRDDGLDCASGRLALGAPRTLHDRSIGRMLRGISALARVATGIPLSWHETKWCSRAAFTSNARELSQGWAIHEVVRFT